MEVVAYGDQTMRFNSLLGLGEAYDFMRVKISFECTCSSTLRFNSLLGLGEVYDFMRVGFAPTYVDRLHYIFLFVC